MDHRHKVEALLFSSGKLMDIEEISRLCRLSTEDTQRALDELEKEYANRDSSIAVLHEGSKWKLTVKDEHLGVMSKVVTETELNKAVLETLAVIAFKYPVKQSEVIRVRNNKAYDHLAELEEAGYITRQRYGRTRIIKLTQKFFDYFDLPREKLKEQFETFEGLAKAIEQKEHEIASVPEKKEEASRVDTPAEQQTADETPEQEVGEASAESQAAQQEQLSTEEPSEKEEEFVELETPTETAPVNEPAQLPEQTPKPSPENQSVVVEDELAPTEFGDEQPHVTPVYDLPSGDIVEDKQHMGDLDVYETEETPSEDGQDDAPEAPSDDSSPTEESSVKTENETEEPDKEETDAPALKTPPDSINVEGLKIKTEEEKAVEKIEKEIEEKVDDLMHEKKNSEKDTDTDADKDAETEE